MEQIFKNKTYQVLELFIQFPNKEHSIRGIARTLNFSHGTIINIIKELLKKQLIKKKKETLYPTYYANTEDENYKLHKKNYLTHRIINSKIIKYIQEKTLPNTIILFGSGAKATFTEKSDIDIFVETTETKINLSKFENKLKHKINLLFEPNINNLSKELRNNIINGITLYGFVKVK